LSLVIEKGRCTACGACADACPGGLLSAARGVCEIDHPADCWGCAACLKACPEEALSLRLPPALGGLGGRLKCRHVDGRLCWVYIRPDGEEILIDGEGDESGY
jgi:adenylylsulfate reductase subunit B